MERPGTHQWDICSLPQGRLELHATAAMLRTAASGHESIPVLPIGELLVQRDPATNDELGIWPPRATKRSIWEAIAVCLCHLLGACAIADKLAPGSAWEGISHTPLRRNFLVSEDDLGQNLSIDLSNNVDGIEEESQEMSVHPGRGRSRWSR
jgi:hypothetical protein